MPSVIWNYPGNPGTVKKIALDQMTWNKTGTHSYYDAASNRAAYTPTTSALYNGTATPDHVIFTRTALRFLGYGIDNNVDLVWTDAYNSFDTLDFTFIPTKIRIHTLNQTGFLFNGSFGGPGNAYYTGYALVLDATAYVANNQAGTASLKLVYINNQLLNPTGTNTFPAAGIAFATQDTIMANINETVTPSFHVTLVKTALGFDLYIDGNMVRQIEPADGQTLPGFGFYTGYYVHNCPVLTVVEYSDVTIAVNTGPAVTSPMVKFVDKDTGKEIAPAQTVPSNTSVSYTDDEFLVDASLVQTITDAGGKDYTYVGASIADLNHITYKAGGAANNTVILYYKDPALMPEKHASVAGVAGDGTASDPVPVNQYDIIDYRIDVKAAHQPPGAPIIYGGTDPTALPLTSITAADTGYVGTTAPGTWTNFNLTSAAYPNGTNTVSATTPAISFIQSVRRQGNYTANAVYQHYLWLTTNANLPAGSYSVTIKYAADARTWGQTGAAEDNVISPSTNVKALISGIVGGATTLSPATYNKPGGYSTFTDQFLPATSGTGRNSGITFRNGPAGTLGVNTNDARTLAAANSNTAPFVTSETSTFTSSLVLSADQQAVIGLVLGGTLSGNTFSSQEHYTSLIRVFSVTFTPLSPPPAPYDVSDLLPAGLTLADDLPNYMTIGDAVGSSGCTATGVSNTFVKGVDTDTSRQQLSWSFPNLTGDTSICFKARVSAVSGIFENSALVTNLSSPVVVPDQTNSTWHVAGMVKVTEKYRNFLTGDTLQYDTYTWIPVGGGYGVAPALLAPIEIGSKTYRYHAYLPDDGAATPIIAIPPDGLPNADPNGDGGNPVLTYDYLYDPVNDNSRVVILYFVPDVTITIISMDHSVVDRTSTVRAPALTTWVNYSVPGGVAYIMSPTHMNSFSGYNYVSVYDLNYGSAMTGVPPTPVFTAAEMYQDNEITLDFAQDPLITLKFIEDGNETHVLHNPMTDIVTYGNDYDPAQSNPPALLQDPITGVWYQFVGYRLDSTSSTDNVYTSDIGTLPTISNVVANHTYRLLYKVATATLTISKVVAGQFGDLTKQFTFKITLLGADGQPLAGPLDYTGDPNTGPANGSLVLNAGVGLFTLSDGQSITLQDLPIDCSVQIVETPNAGYETSIEDSENAATPDPANPGDTGAFGMTLNPRTITFTNTRMVPPATGVGLGGNGLIPLSALGPLLMLAFYVGRREVLRRTFRVGL